MKVAQESYQLQLPRDGSRSKGTHLSDIIRDLAFTMRVLDEKYRNQNLEDDDTTLMQMGLGWEDYLAKYQHPEIDFHPGELSLDGIYMTPDGMSMVDSEDLAEMMGVDPLDWILHEFKLTMKSSRDFADALRLRSKKVLMWLWQVLAYRLAMNKELEKMCLAPCYVAKLHVMFVHGNYSKDFTDAESRPTYKIYRMTFTQEELDDNWLMITSHRDLMEKRTAVV